MPDISMCASEICCLSRECYRHKDSGTKPSCYQTYADFKPDEDGKCEDFWERKGAA